MKASTEVSYDRISTIATADYEMKPMPNFESLFVEFHLKYGMN